MRYQYTEEINYHYEAGALIERHYNKETNYKKQQEFYLQKNTIDAKLVEKLFAPLIQIEEEVFDQVEITAEDYDFYFRCSKNDNNQSLFILNLYRLLLILDELKIKDSEIQKKIFISLLFEDIKYQKEKPLISDEIFLKLLKQKDMDAQMKWNVYDVYTNIKMHLSKINQIVKPVIQILKKHEKRLKQIIHDNPYKEDLYYLKKDASLAAFIEDDFVLHFSVFGYNEVSVHEYEVKPYILIPMYYGAYIDILIHEENKQKNISSRLVKKLNALSDNSRIGILCELKQHDLCGQQLKEALHLSNATISHHMNELLQDNFVTTRKEGNKVVYAINKVVIEETLAEIKALLLD